MLFFSLIAYSECWFRSRLFCTLVLKEVSWTSLAPSVSKKDVLRTELTKSCFCPSAAWANLRPQLAEQSQVTFWSEKRHWGSCANIWKETAASGGPVWTLVSHTSIHWLGETLKPAFLMQECICVVFRNNCVSTNAFEAFFPWLYLGVFFKINNWRHL